MLGVDGRRGLRFPEKPRRQLAARDQMRVEQLDGDATTDAGVQPFVDHPHPALADQSDESVFPVEDVSYIDHAYPFVC